MHEVSGFVADDLMGAMKEAHALARGTRCKQYLFSVSLSPPASESVRTEVFEKACDTIEERLTAIQLLGNVGDLPAGLTPGTVNRWMSGLIREASSEHFSYVVALWTALPSITKGEAAGHFHPVKRGKSYPVASAEWLEVTHDMSATLRAELARTGIDHASLLDGLTGIPRGLNARVVKGWLYREAATTRATHWAFVIEYLRSLPA